MKSPGLKIFLKLFIILIIIGLIYYFLLRPKVSSLSQNQASIEKINIDWQDSDNKLGELKKIDKDRTQLTETKQLVTSYLPDETTPSSFVVKLEGLTSTIPIIIDSLGITEPKVAPAPVKSEDDSSSSKTSTAAKPAAKPVEKVLNFSTSSRATYDKIILFFQKMEQFSRFNTIETVSISGYTATDGTLDLKTSGTIYYGK